MTAVRFMDGLWFTLFFAALAGVGQAVLPETPLFRFAWLPSWFAYRVLTRRDRIGCWAPLWAGLLCETMWDLPPLGGVIGCALLAWVLKGLEDLFPRHPLTRHGVFVGLVLTPAVWLWALGYALLFRGTDALALVPGAGSIVAAPVVGAALGGFAFWLYGRWNFLCLEEPTEADDEG